MAPIELLLLGPGDADLLDDVAEDVFDGAVESRWTKTFLADPRHHLIVAREAGVVVGIISAVDYVHPDKAAQLWINEVGVAPSHQRRGIGRRLMDAMLKHGRTLGCTEAWVTTEVDNLPAQGLYESAGAKPETVLYYSYRIAPHTNETRPAASAIDGDEAG